LPGPGAVTVTAPAGAYADAYVNPQEFFKESLGDSARVTGDRNMFNRVTVIGYTARAHPTFQDEFQAIVLVNPRKETKEIRRQVTLEPARKVKGTVTGPDGKTLGGARVRGLTAALDFATLSGADFSMAGPNPQRPRTLLALHEAKRLVGTLNVKADERGPLQIKLRPWGMIAGRLLDAEGQPYASALVAVNALGTLAYHIGSIPTDKDGKFRIERLIPGVKYSFSFFEPRPNGRHGIVVKDVSLTVGQTRELGDVIVRPD
jgi:hypothetical protein